MKDENKTEPVSSHQRELKVTSPRFSLGEVVATSNATATINESDMMDALGRHVSGDWGDTCEEDREANDQALEHGDRLFSVYHDTNGVKFWIITEWDRSYTTILLPDDY